MGALIALLGVVGLMAAPDAGAVGPFDWQLQSPDPPRAEGQTLLGGNSVRLVNATSSQAVVYRVRTYGINLGWADPSGANNVSFLPWPGTRGASLRRDERLSVRVSGGGYLTYRERDYGINLGWSSDPAYEWELRGSGGRFEGDDYARAGDRVGLFNTRIGKYVVYGVRTYGINLVWLDASDLPSPSTADVLLSLRLGPFDPPHTCTGSVTWRFSPLRLTGSEGDSRRFAVTRSSYSVPATRTGTGSSYCVVSNRTLSVRVGRWRIQLVTPRWRAFCVVDLRGGGNLVNFSDRRSGCRTAAAFP